VSERVLSTRELNRALLARQLLLERARLPIPRALERIGGIQNQYAPSGYVGLWTRLDGFERDALTRALERRTAVQGTLMRVTIHLVSAREYWLFAMGVRRARREWWLKQRKLDERELERGAERVRAALAQGPRSVKELGDLASGFLGHVGLWVDLVRIPPSGTWERRRADLLGLAEDWVGPCEVSEEEGLEHLVRSHLRGFGPASPRDVASWAGVPAGPVASAIERLTLRRFRDEQGRVLYDLPRAPLPPADTPAPVRFLPHWDANLLVHARRTQVLPKRHRERVFATKNPFSVGTFLVDGAVAGSWHEERGRVVLDAFEPLTRSVVRDVEEEAGRLETFLA
jgi:Winged helix DNA-binding domain